MNFLDSIFVAHFALCQYSILIHSFYGSIATLKFMLPQLFTYEGQCTSFPLVFTIELDLTYHIFQNGIYINVLCIISVTVRTCSVLIFPNVNAGGAKQLVLASVAIHRLPIICNYLITNAAKD
jgi:hypothetical protein